MSEPLSGWPLLEEVIGRWSERDVLKADEFYALADEARARSFTAKRLWDQRALEQTLESLQRAMAAGKTLREWRQESWEPLAERFGTAGADVSHYVDTVFRTNTQAAFAGGRYAEMFSPEWIEASPYWMYSAIHDGRTRPAHKALDGRVFLKTDPAARKYLPPISFNCRCMAVEMTQEDLEAGGYKITPGDEIKRLPLVDSRGRPLVNRKTGKPLLLGEPPEGWNSDRVESLVPGVLKAKPIVLPTLQPLKTLPALQPIQTLPALQPITKLPALQPIAKLPTLPPLPTVDDLPAWTPRQLSNPVPGWGAGFAYDRKPTAVVFDAKGRVLLREPMNHTGGYHWTWPKGNLPPGGAGHARVALDALTAETGIKGEIVGAVPGQFGYAGSGKFEAYIMRAKGFDPAAMGDKSFRWRWATIDEAEEMIKQSSSAQGMKRDLDLLAAAKAEHTKLIQEAATKGVTKMPKGIPAGLQPVPLDYVNPKALSNPWMMGVTPSEISGVVPPPPGWVVPTAVATPVPVVPAPTPVPSVAPLAKGKKPTIDDLPAWSQPKLDDDPHWGGVQGWENPPSLPNRNYGAVVFDQKGRILLREPTNHFDGYHWTFPKGGWEPGNKPWETALRELEEETGTIGEIVGAVPGAFESGGIKRNYFYVARSQGWDPGKLDWETLRCKWVTPKQAEYLIKKSTNAAGKARDLKVLAAAVEEHKRLLQEAVGTGIPTGAQPKLKAGLGWMPDEFTNPLGAAKQTSAIEPINFPASISGKAKKPKSVPTPIKPISNNTQFPAEEELHNLAVIKKLGGSTGAELVQDGKGRKFVRKRGSSPDHLREEVYADSVYRGMGVAVPEFHLYETATGPVKLSVYIEGTETLASVLKQGGPRAEQVVDAIRKDFAVDAAMGNWDVIGLDADNILVDSAGVPWRIDNGGCLRYRAQGALKDTKFWTDWPEELWTLRSTQYTAPATQKIFGGLTWKEIRPDVNGLKPLIADAVQALPPELKSRVATRLENALDAAIVAADFEEDGWKPDYIEDFLQHMKGLRAAGIPQKFPKSMAEKGGYGAYYAVDENGKKWDELRGSKSRMADWTKYVKSIGGDPGFLSKWAQSQAGSSWSEQSKAYKWFIRTHGRPSPNYFWKGGEDTARGLYNHYVQKYGLETIRKTMIAHHALVYELLLRTDFGDRNAEERLIRVFRTEDIDVMNLYGVAKGKNRKMIRGAVESCSIFRKVFVYGSEITRQGVPFIRALGVYLFERSVGFSQSMFMGDAENELVALLDDLFFDYE